MPAPIVGALGQYISDSLAVTVWDGEIPRYTATTPAQPINPSSNAVVWPIVKVYMSESGFTREWTTEDPYCDSGEIIIKIWGISRLQAETSMNGIEALLAQAHNWEQVELGGPQDNENYIISMLLKRYYSGQEEEIRSAQSQLLYRCDMYYNVEVHGAISTF